MAVSTEASVGINVFVERLFHPFFPASLVGDPRVWTIEERAIHQEPSGNRPLVVKTEVCDTLYRVV